MKAYKNLLICQAILMYIAHLPFYLFLILIKFFMIESIEKLLSWLLLIGVILTIIIMPICFVNYIFGITSVIKKEYNPTKITNIIKLALIPWYALNFIICLLFIGAMANPWLFMATPIVAAIQVCTTLIFMTSTSIYDISFMISKMIKKEISCNVLNVFLIIFLLIFGLDVISSIIIYCKFKDK